jgi:phage-related holin
MKLEFNEIKDEVILYLSNAWITVNPALKWVGLVLCYILFPTKAYATYAMIVAGMVIFDLASKYYSVSVQNGGLWNAIRTKKLTSNSMWMGTRKKIVSYFVVMILVGLSYRFEMLQTPTEFLGTLAYLVIFLREGQSVIENMMDAGHKELRWLYFILRRKNKQVLENIGMTDEELKDLEKKEGYQNEKE